MPSGDEFIRARSRSATAGDDGVERAPSSAGSAERDDGREKSERGFDHGWTNGQETVQVSGPLRGLSARVRLPLRWTGRGRRWHGRARTRIVLFLGMGVLATLIGVAAYAGHLLRSIELKSVDTRFALRELDAQAEGRGRRRDRRRTRSTTSTSTGSTATRTSRPVAVPAAVLRAGDRTDRRGPSEGDRDRHQFTEPTDRGRRQRADPVGHEGEARRAVGDRKVDANGTTDVFGGYVPSGVAPGQHATSSRTPTA